MRRNATGSDSHPGLLVWRSARSRAGISSWPDALRGTSVLGHQLQQTHTGVCICARGGSTQRAKVTVPVWSPLKHGCTWCVSNPFGFWVQGYLAHKKAPTPWDHHMFLAGVVVYERGTPVQVYRGSSLIRKRLALGTYSRTMLTALRWSGGGGIFLSLSLFLSIHVYICIYIYVSVSLCLSLSVFLSLSLPLPPSLLFRS